MPAIDGALVFVAALWILFGIGVYYVRKDKKKEVPFSSKWGTDKAGRR